MPRPAAVPAAKPPRVPQGRRLRLRPARPGRSAVARDTAPARRSRPLAPRPGHFPAKAKRCIFLFMTGGPSQMDLFDPKPLLNRLDGQPLPPSFGKIHSQFLENDPLCLGSHRKWGKYGQSGIDMSDLVPHMHPLADDIALVRSCYADSVIHAPAMYQMNTGRVFMGFPSLGSWVTYGLGSESEDLPAFVVMTQPEGTPEGGAPCWGAGFLPAHHQGTLFRSGPVPIVNLRPPAGVTPPPPARDARPAEIDERAGPRPVGHRALGADLDLRAGLPHAERRARGRRPLGRAGGDPIALRAGRPAHRRVRHALPAGPPPGRARRPVRPALFGRRPGGVAVGCPRRHRRQPREDVRRDRQAGRRAARRTSSGRACSTRRWSSGAASSAGRPCARAAAGAAITTPPGSPCGWPAAA